MAKLDSDGPGMCGHGPPRFGSSTGKSFRHQCLGRRSVQKNTPQSPRNLELGHGVDELRPEAPQRTRPTLLLSLRGSLTIIWVPPSSAVVRAPLTGKRHLELSRDSLGPTAASDRDDRIWTCNPMPPRTSAAGFSVRPGDR